jgi:DNA mismatch repair protein MutS
MVEMIETARILRSATPRSLVILDEIGRGTSTFDGLSIAWAVAEHLHDHTGARTLFATHYHELTDISRERPGIVNFHVAVKEWNEKIVFLRTLAPGPTNKSYGVQVARLAGLPAPVLARAREILSALEAQELAAVERGTFEHERSGRPAPQLDLFAQKSATDRLLELLREELLGLDLDALSPKQTWELLQSWQARLREEES